MQLVAPIRHDQEFVFDESLGLLSERVHERTRDGPMGGYGHIVPLAGISISYRNEVFVNVRPLIASA